MPPDWTAGCIAVTNAEIEELFAATAIGTEVEIRP
jgi:lipoprotein-anchoring transpeptidase ErfK/SrfK